MLSKFQKSQSAQKSRLLGANTAKTAQILSRRNLSCPACPAASKNRCICVKEKKNNGGP